MKQQGVVKQDLVVAARVLAIEKLKGLLRGNGRPFIEHADGVAAIVEKELGLSKQVVAAVYLHEASRKNPDMLPEIIQTYGEEIAHMVTGLNKISTINPRDTRLQPENYRKLIVSYSTDPTVILIKLADRLEIMHNLTTCFSANDQMKKATETLMLYVPLAHQLGLYHTKSRLEDLSFKVLQPEDYRLVVNSLKASEREQNAMMQRFSALLEKALKEAGICYELKSRTKAVYSIWRKMQAQQLAVEEVYDILGIRFIIDAEPEKEKDLCWQVYSIVTQIYEPIPERMRDWITVPKESGYESLHITVKTPEGKVVEVQIRSRRMDVMAEYGVAAHWAYKGVRNEQVLQNWLSGIRKRLQEPDKAEEGMGEPVVFTPNEIYVFTPAGDLRRLPSGATVLDFAFEIHSNLGIRCTGGRINGKMSQMRDVLQTGDTVEIFTSKNQKPSKDWLGYVVSGKARSKIRQTLREEEGVRVAEGREMLERRLKNWKMEALPEEYAQLLKHYKMKQLNDFYAAIANENIPLQEIKKTLIQFKEEKQEKTVPDPALLDRPVMPPTHMDDYLIIDDSFGRIGFKLAKCCNPVVGDKVFGFVSVKDGIKIHRMSCPNAERLITQYPYRIQKVKWRESAASAIFQTTIKFMAYEEIGLMQAVSDTVNMLSLNLRSFRYSGRHGKISGILQIAVNSNKQVDLLLFHLRKIKGMVKVSRE